MPTEASWLNMVERFFAEITERQIRRGIHTSVKDLESAIDAYIERRNEDPRPFTWVRTADDILAPSSASAFESAPTVLLPTSDPEHSSPELKFAA